MKFRRSKRLKVRADLNMTPLIDVVFLLILFFMLSSTFVVQNSINIKMAEAEGDTSFEQKDLSITLQYGPGGPDNKGPIYVNNEEIQTLEEFSRKLAEARADHPDVRMLVRPDARIESARLIQVLGIANSVGIERYGIVASPPSEEIPK